MIDPRRFPNLLKTLNPWERYPTVGAIVLARNVDNVEDVDKYVEEWAQRQTEPVQKWLRGNLRNWLISDSEDVTQIGKYKGAPAWLDKAIERGEKVWHVNFSRPTNNKIQHVLDWFRSGAAPEKLDRLTVPEAFKQSDAWTQKFLKKKVDEEEAGVGEKIIKQYDDGYSWREMISEASLAREGKLMGHCAGGYWKNVESGQVAIWSLRDKKNEPHCTMELHPGTEYIQQIKGKQNAAVVPQYHPYVKDILNDNLSGWSFDYNELGNAGLFEKNGKIFDIEDLKKDPELLKKYVDDYIGSHKDSVTGTELTPEGLWIHTYGADTLLPMLEGFIRPKDIERLRGVLEDYPEVDYEVSDDDIETMIDSLEKKHPKTHKKIIDEIEKLSDETGDEWDGRDVGGWVKKHRDQMEVIYDAVQSALGDGWGTGTQDAAYKYIGNMLDGLEWDDGSRVTKEKDGKMAWLVSLKSLVTNDTPELKDNPPWDSRDSGFESEFDEDTAKERFYEVLSENDYTVD